MSTDAASLDLPVAGPFKRVKELPFEEAVRILLTLLKNPPAGFEHLKDLIPDLSDADDIIDYINNVIDQLKKRAQIIEYQTNNGLTDDEVKALHVYKIECPYPVYKWLNAWLMSSRRDEDVQKAIGPFFIILNRAMSKLPKIKSRAARAIKVRSIPGLVATFDTYTQRCAAGERLSFWGFASFSTDDAVINSQQFMGDINEQAIIFSCGMLEGVDMEPFAPAGMKEKEILPLCPTIFEVQASVMVGCKLTIAVKQLDNNAFAYIRLVNAASSAAEHLANDQRQREPGTHTLSSANSAAQFQPSSLWSSPNLLRNAYGNLVQQFNSLNWAPSATSAPLLVSNDVTDIGHPLFQFVVSKLRPTPFVRRTSTFQKDYPFTRPISRIQFVHSDTASMMFAQIHDSESRTRAANPVLQVSPFTDPNSVAAIAKLQSVFEDPAANPLNNSPNLSRILFAWHGTGADFVEAVCRDGPRALRTTDGGFFGAGTDFALEAEYAAQYAMMYGPNNNNEYSIILYAVSVSQTYPITLEKDYRKIEDPATPLLHGFSNFYSPDGNKAVALLPKYDSHFVPTKNYHYQHPLGNYQVGGQTKQTVPRDVDCQACSESDPDTVGHELVIGNYLRALPIAIVYFK